MLCFLQKDFGKVQVVCMAGKVINNIYFIYQGWGTNFTITGRMN